MTIRATLCFIVKEGNVLLLKKSKGLFGEGKWNVPGGKIEPGESAGQAAVREAFEETRLTIAAPKHLGVVYFYKHGMREDPDWIGEVFLSDNFNGRPESGREGVVKWFSVDSLPFEEMWEDDRYWWTLALAGESFEGWFYYSGDFEKLIDYRIERRDADQVRA